MPKKYANVYAITRLFQTNHGKSIVYPLKNTPHWLRCTRPISVSVAQNIPRSPEKLGFSVASSFRVCWYPRRPSAAASSWPFCVLGIKRSHWGLSLASRECRYGISGQEFAYNYRRMCRCTIVMDNTPILPPWIWSHTTLSNAWEPPRRNYHWQFVFQGEIRDATIPRTSKKQQSAWL